MAYRTLFRAQLDRAAVDDIRLTLNQDQPLGNERFYATIEKTTGCGGAWSGWGCFSKFVSAELRHAQRGALNTQMLASGLMDDGSLSVPSLTTVRPSLPVLSANK